MEAVAYLDTHVVFWLYGEGAGARLTDRARTALLEAPELRISPMVRLELQYLREAQRIGVGPAPILDELGAPVGPVVCSAAFEAVVREAERHSWTRDPFDRLVVAQAALHDAPLITKDASIREQLRGRRLVAGDKQAHHSLPLHYRRRRLRARRGVPSVKAERKH